MKANITTRLDRKAAKYDVTMTIFDDDGKVILPTDYFESDAEATLCIRCFLILLKEKQCEVHQTDMFIGKRKTDVYYTDYTEVA